jgi:putative two-component system response regulator
MPRVATVMITVVDGTELADKALDLGAYGYIVKPFSKNEVLICLSNALRRQKLELENEEHRDRLQSMVKERTASLWTALQVVEQREQDLRISREDTIERLSIAAEFRDDETASHIKRMSGYCGMLSRWAGLDADRSEMVRIASVMHDVGKIGIPDRVLQKPGKLTPDEYELMQQHPEFGFRILSSPNSELLTLAASIALTHHEKWDGSGYPRGLRGQEIPLEGRIAAVADVFDALITNRCYRKAFGLTEAITMMKEGRGSHFDPEILDLLLDHLSEILTMKKREEDAASALLDLTPAA